MVTIEELYGTKAESARRRYEKMTEQFREAFGCSPERYFSAPGRTEIGGNHTDHQHGCVLAAAVDLDTIAAVSVTDSGLFELVSEGNGSFSLSLSELSVREEEKGTTSALMRGTAAGFAGLGADFRGKGLRAFVTSQVPAGSGLSSSAAFEVLLGVIFNACFFGGKADAPEIARLGQKTENVFFGKPSGLMDQTASAVGSAVAIDFADPAAPLIRKVGLDLQKEGYALCILDSGAGHEDLTDQYAAIPAECREVSACFGKKVLRDVSEEDFLKSLPSVREACGDRAALRALHFFEENRRAKQEAEALEKGDFEGFLSLVAASGRSSALYLQNIVPCGAVRHQEMMLTLALAEKILGGRGAVRVHGGGFGGTAQAFVPADLLEDFRRETEAVLGKGSCRVLSVRAFGGTEVLIQEERR